MDIRLHPGWKKRARTAQNDWTWDTHLMNLTCKSIALDITQAPGRTCSYSYNCLDVVHKYQHFRVSHSWVLFCTIVPKGSPRAHPDTVQHVSEGPLLHCPNFEGSPLGIRLS